MGTEYLSGVGEFLKLLAMDSNPIQEGRGGKVLIIITFIYYLWR